MRVVRSLSSMVVVAGLMAACGGKQVPRNKLDDDPPAEPEPSYTLTGVPSMQKFEQPFQREIDIMAGARVDRGNPMIEIRDMPKGATFEDGIFTWAPPCDLGDAFFGGVWRAGERRVNQHDLTVVLRSDVEPEHFTEKMIALVVYEFREFPPELTCEGAQQ